MKFVARISIDDDPHIYLEHEPPPIPRPEGVGRPLEKITFDGGQTRFLRLAHDRRNDSVEDRRIWVKFMKSSMRHGMILTYAANSRLWLCRYQGCRVRWPQLALIMPQSYGLRLT